MPSVADEIPLTFPCAGDTLIGILHLPSAVPSVGVVIVVGGPQYRAGSHRQFVLLGRSLAARGIAALRFDCRGMGDSNGTFPGFEHIEPDIAAAVDMMIDRLPSLRRIVLWGLCDATLAIAENARSDPRIVGIVLLNPWVRSEIGLARTRLKHYYLARLVQADFLRKLLHGQFDARASARALWTNVCRAYSSAGERATEGGAAIANPLAERLLSELKRFKGRILFLLSGRDLTAKEFEDATGKAKAWQELFLEGRVTRQSLPAADHTFSRRIWRDEVADLTEKWINAVDAPS